MEDSVKLGNQVKAAAMLILGCVLLFWLVEFLNLVLGHSLNRYGILPRSFSGLVGIAFSPFLHSGIRHLLLNTIPFVVLGGLVSLRGIREFLELSLFVVVVGGLAVWLFGRSAYHVGASGLIFGYFGYLVASGWYERSIGSIVIAFATLSLYGGLIWGVLPVFVYISWEGHLFGLLAGVLGARIVRSK
ncbi:rhomboid family intramembrane serine protease [bacterium]|nr:rhomboid family intramembrane serine protease [bacterium]